MNARYMAAFIAGDIDECARLAKEHFQRSTNETNMNTTDDAPTPDTATEEGFMHVYRADGSLMGRTSLRTGEFTPISKDAK